MLVVVEKLVDRATVEQLRTGLESASWEDGRLTAGGSAVGVKNNAQLPATGEAALRLGRIVLDALWANPLFISAALPKTIYPPRFNRYADGQTYGAHVDGALMRAPGADQMMRTDLSATLFISDPDSYDGGELEIETGFGLQSVKLAAGDLVLYPATSLHRVAPVTRGTRLASFFWVQSAVADEQARTMLFDLDRSIQTLAAQQTADPGALQTLTGLYHNLLRRWAQT